MDDLTDVLLKMQDRDLTGLSDYKHPGQYRKPYSTRHTFAAWSLTIDCDPNCLVTLMKHASKQMVYETYGKYTDGLEKDRQAILDYFGDDFAPTS